MGGTHSLCSPSGAHRWLICHAAPAATQHLPERRTRDSAHGTAKHACGYECLTKGLSSAGVFYGQEWEADGFKFKVDDEFIAHVDYYIEAVRREPGKQFYEIQLDTSAVLNVSGQGGTADCICLDTETDTLTVMDAKFGFHQVDAEGNPQGMLYLAGARRRYERVAEWKKFRFIIVQPKLDHIDIAEYTLAQLEAFEEKAGKAARQVALVSQMRPELIEEHKTPHPVACEWCDVRQECKARSNSIAAMFTPIKPPAPPGIDNEQLAKYLALVDDVAQWCKDVKQEAFQRAMAGQIVPGYKLNQGRKGDRYWLEPPEKMAPKLVALGLFPDDLFEPAALKSPAEIEALCKARKIGTAPLKAENEKSLVGQSEGGARLVEASAKGKPYVLVKPEFQPSMESLV